MPHRIVILGGGTAGTMIANRLLRELGDDARIVVVDRDNRHVYQPGLLFVPFGLADPDELVRPRGLQLHDGIEFILAEVDRVDTGDAKVYLTSGKRIGYDVLVIASGATLLPEETDGLTGAGWEQSMFTFYTLDGATKLRDALSRLESGRLLVNIVDLPIKCPVAPLEFCFLADWFLRERGVRGDVELMFATPLDAPFTTALASAQLGGLMVDKEIAVETEFSTGRVDGAAGKLISWEEREISFDLLVAIPVHGGAPFVSRSPGLGDELGFVLTDQRTLQSRSAPNVFAIGDATNVPTSKAGSVTHFESQTLISNIRRFLDGRELEGSFDGHANCFVETGFHKALLIDFNYAVEPLPGRFPIPRLGPLPLLAESRLNHIAKLAFQWLYWHVLLPGHHLPGISPQLHPASKTTQGAPA
ncbi:MAG TPA: FAD/NAD(P)-binding oxidoreductase [Solirubrobacteraceae bacterium]|nr:FAD/NAD(P)-binding oxidoreductase [Solirubrobacteraceae bacterium]